MGNEVNELPNFPTFERDTCGFLDKSQDGKDISRLNISMKYYFIATQGT